MLMCMERSTKLNVEKKQKNGQTLEKALAAQRGNKMQYGVTIGTKGPMLDSRVIAAMQDLGLDSLRFQVPSSLVCDNGGIVRKWELWDNAVQQCQDGHVKLYLTVKQLPKTLLQNGLPTAVALQKISSQIARRYAGKLAGIEIGNEDFNLSSVFYFTSLGQAMKACYPAIKSIDHTIQVIPGALLQRNSKNIIQAVEDLTYEAYTANWDVLNFHFYTGIPGNGHIAPDDGTVQNVPSFQQYIDDIKQGMKGVQVPIWCTEYGFTVNQNFGRALRTVVSQETQASYIKYCLDTARANNVGAMFLFTIGYHNPTDGMSIIQDGNKTLAYDLIKAYPKV